MLTPLENNFKRSLDSWFSKKLIREVDFIQKLNIHNIVCSQENYAKNVVKILYYFQYNDDNVKIL